MNDVRPVAGNWRIITAFAAPARPLTVYWASGVTSGAAAPLRRRPAVTIASVRVLRPSYRHSSGRSRRPIQSISARTTQVRPAT